MNSERSTPDAGRALAGTSVGRRVIQLPPLSSPRAGPPQVATRSAP